MKNSQFEAKTFGVGELIMQRKLFIVPPHQRSYAWGKEAIDEFLDDIETARSNGAADYFIGLIVIQGSSDGEWILLDGQQRLSTVSLIYAAIRYWFHAAGFTDDAKQINHDYLGVRRLGGDYSSRLALNKENQNAFQQVAANLLSDRELATLAQTLPKRSSNRLLLDAAVYVRQWVSKIAGERSSNNREGANGLYALARFLESKLKVVAVEVSSEVDAYVLFESLNDRGVALSALDLIKNYIFSKQPAGQELWTNLTAALAGVDPEDFLKIFWTSRYGNIQKSQIFKGVKDRYQDTAAAGQLLLELQRDAALLSAIYDDDHPIWAERDRRVRDELYLLRFLDSKQARPVILAILRALADETLALQMIGMLAAALFRFQVVGKGRTGVVEKVIGRLCAGIANGSLDSAITFKRAIDELLTSDPEFRGQLMAYTDLRYSRLAYVLAEDIVYQIAQAGKTYEVSDGVGDRVTRVREVLERTRLVRINSGSSLSADGVDIFGLVGNYQLVPTESGSPLDLSFLTSRVADDSVEGVLRRTREFVDRACTIWSPSQWGA